MARKTRGKGEGSIYPLPNGKWMVQVENGTYANGRRRYARRQVATKADAGPALRELQRLADLSVQIDQSRTVEEYLTWWLANVAVSGLKPSVHEDYEGVVRRYIVPHIGSKRLVRLTPAHVQAMLRSLEEAGLSPRTRQYARSVLRRALSWAVVSELVPRNVAALVEGPKVSTRDARIDDALTAGEAAAVLSTARGDRLYALAHLVLHLGLRRGEALALHWADVDFDGGDLHVRGTLKRKRGGGAYVDRPKTKAGERTIPLIAPVAEALAEHRKLQAVERAEAGDIWHEQGFVFTDEAGAPVRPDQAYRWWRELTERAGVGPRRFHASRHTCATLMLAAGTPLEVVSAVMGHANLSITADTYARVGADAKRNALANLHTSLGDGT